MPRSLAVLSLVLTIAGTVAAQPPPPPPAPRPAAQGAPPRDASARPTVGTARITGRVIAADSGAPLRRAQVRLNGGGRREGQSITTDAEGAFTFDRLPAGTYTLSAQKTNFIAMTYGQKRPSVGPGRPVKVADGQKVDRIEFAMMRAGVISGRVTDDVGEPVANAMVQAIRPMRFAGGPLSVANSVQTDDLGQFRLHSLQPGEYIVSVSPRNLNPGGGESLDRTGYAPTFFPGTPTMAEAQKVAVQSGLETPNVTIALTLTQLAKVSGMAIDPRGNPLPRGGSVQLRPATSVPGFGNLGGSGIRPDGTFTIQNVAPGSYTLEIRTGGPEPLFASAAIAVSGQDVTNVGMMLAPGATARGKIVFEGGEPPPYRQGINLVSATALAGEPAGPSGPARTLEDWTFEIKGLFGKKLLRGGAPGQGWMLKAITYRGTDVTDTGVEFKGSDVIDGFEVKFVKSTTSIEAAVIDVDGQPDADAVVVVYSTDRAKWTPQSRYVRLVYPNPEGRMIVNNLPPGDYYVAATEILEPGFERNPETLERLSHGAERITLFDNDKKQLTLRK